MSRILYLAIALIGITTSVHAQVSTQAVGYRAHASAPNARLMRALGQSTNGWVATKSHAQPVRSRTSASPRIDQRESYAQTEDDSVQHVFSRRTHWANASQPVFMQAWNAASEPVIRAQNAADPAYEEPPQVNSNLQQPILLPPTTGQEWVPPGGPTWGGPIPNATPIGSRYGAAGSRPFRFGSQWKMDMGFLPKESTSSSVGPLGHLSIFEINTELRYTAPTSGQYVWSFAPQFNVRSYNANPPAGTAPIPNDVYRFGTDIQLTSPNFGGYTMELGFTPSFNTDFERQLTSESWTWDARGALFFRSSPRYMLVLGAMYWDRVNDQVLPWAGWVYTPNDRLEIRAVFPNPEISYFLGAPNGMSQWLYLAGAYHIEAYQVEGNQAGIPIDRMELEDWRVMLGVRTDGQGYSSFLEAGWVFGREVEYLRSVTPTGGSLGFDISSGFIARFGFRF